MKLGLIALCATAACGTDTTTNTTVTAPDTTPPLVVWTTPQPASSSVAPATQISAVFSEEMNTATIDASTFTLTAGGSAVTGTVSIGDGRTALFAPSQLAPGTMYTATISTGAEDLAGNGLPAAVTWSFTTAANDTSAPTIANKTPPDGSVGNTLGDTVVSVTLTKPLDCASVTSASLQVFEHAVVVPGYVTCSGATLTFHSIFTLPTGTVLDALVPAGLRDTDGNSLAISAGWTFGMAPWTTHISTADYDHAQAIAHDTTGHLYIAGSTLGNLDGASAGEADMFLTKLDANGTPIWTRQLGGASSDIGTGVAVDSSGNVFVTGSTFGGFDGTANAGGDDIFVVKYDANGTKQWSRQLGTTADDDAFAIATDAAGNVYAVGGTNGDLGGGMNAGSEDLFVVKYDSAGTLQFTVVYGTTEVEQANGIAIDANGFLYVAGETFGALDGQTNAGGADAFLIKYSSTGAKQWTRVLGATFSDDIGQAVTIDPFGSPIVAGITSGSIYSQPLVGQYDAFVMKWDAAGSFDWVRQVGTGGVDTTNAIATDAAGNVYVAGGAYGYFDAPEDTYLLNENMALIKLDGNGGLQWTRELAGGSVLEAHGITTDAHGGIYLACFSDGGLDHLANAGDYDAYVIKYEQDGRKR